MKASRKDSSTSSSESLTRRDVLKGLMIASLVCASGTCVADPARPRAESKSRANDQGILSLDDLSGDWMRMSDLGNYPAINNFLGALQVTDNMLAVRELTFPPYSQGGHVSNGEPPFTSGQPGMHSGNLRLNGQEVMAQESRWYAYQILRRTKFQNIEAENSVRMVFEGRGVLFRLTLKNPTSAAQTVEVSADLNGFIGRYDFGWDNYIGRSEEGWDFLLPHPADQAEFTASAAADGKSLLVRHSKSPARCAFAFAEKPEELKSEGNHGSATWKVVVSPGQSRNIDYVLAVGAYDGEALFLAEKWASEFDQTFEAAKKGWEKRYIGAFVPGNNFYSGSLPILETPDQAIRRVYYMGIVSRLQMLRTNLPVQSRVIVTGAPQYAVTLTYFWDNTLFLMSLLDPEMTREQLKSWLAINLYRWYALDYLSGEGRGVWYSADNVSIFGWLRSYLQITGDYALLDESAGDKTVLEHLKDLATHWKKLVMKDSPLADYGGAENLLECDPTYIHGVASLNAANVGMMRSLAELLEWRGDAEEAAKLRADAKQLAAAVLDLYAPGEGVWHCLQPDGTRIKVRHVYDFVTVVKWMAEDLTPTMRSEMAAFVERELITEKWMRARSWQDPAAPEAQRAHPDRTDHGPMGAYDEWPPLTLGALCMIGYGQKALDAFYRFVGVTHEGPYAQTHELLGRNYDAPVRVAGYGMTTHNMIGTVFNELIIGSFFGFQPDWQGKRVLGEACLPAGFEGQLTGLLYRNKYYNLIAGAKGVTMQAI